MWCFGSSSVKLYTNNEVVTKMNDYVYYSGGKESLKIFDYSSRCYCFVLLCFQVPKTSEYELMKNYPPSSKRIIILNKTDLADRSQTEVRNFCNFRDFRSF